jgi:hypothetical protein
MSELTRLQRRRVDLAQQILSLSPHSYRRAVLCAVQAEVTRRALEIELAVRPQAETPAPAAAEEGQELKWYQK